MLTSKKNKSRLCLGVHPADNAKMWREGDMEYNLLIGPKIIRVARQRHLGEFRPQEIS